MDRAAPAEPTRTIRAIAAIAVLCVGSRIFLGGGVTVGNVVALVLLPLWIPTLARYGGARSFAILGVVAVATGLWLSDFSAADHVVSSNGALSDTVMLLGAIGAVGVLLWARELLPVWLVGTFFGIGMLATAGLAGEFSNENAWKFGIGFPVTIIVLSLLARPGFRWLEVIGLLVFAALAVASDSRYRFATLLIAAVLMLWQLLPTGRSRRVSTVTILGVVAAVFALTYNLATTLLVEGYLGEQAQSRSISQIEKSGSLIAGGRPELAATIALFQHQPGGYGVGVQPNLDDVLAAKTGMAAIGYPPNNGYVEGYLFGGGFELHSVAGDLWALFGLPGLAFVGVCLVLTLRAIGRQLGARNATGVVLVLAISTLWNLLFSPIYGSLSTLVLTIGLGTLPIGPRASGFTSAEASRLSRRGVTYPFAQLK